MSVFNGATLINDFFSLVYPRVCEACGGGLYQHERFICGQCRVSLPESRFHLRDEHEMSLVFGGRVPFRRCCSFFTYEKRGRVQQILHAIKYHGRKELAEHLGAMYAGSLLPAATFDSIDVVVPIPLHARKLRARGFNQSEWFARGLATGLAKPIDTSGFVRSVETATQTRKKKYQRWENVDGIFATPDPARYHNAHILLVDDVITTGATLEAAWQALKAVPGIMVSAASIAFAPRSG